MNAQPSAVLVNETVNGYDRIVSRYPNSQRSLAGVKPRNVQNLYFVAVASTTDPDAALTATVAGVELARQALVQFTKALGVNK